MRAPGRHAGADDDHGHDGVLAEGRALALGQAVRAHVVAVVGGDDDERVVRAAGLRQGGEHCVHRVGDGLRRLRALAPELVQPGLLPGRDRRNGPEPGRLVRADDVVVGGARRDGRLMRRLVAQGDGCRLVRVVRRQRDEEAVARGADEVRRLRRDHVVEEVRGLLAVAHEPTVGVEHVVVAGVRVTARRGHSPAVPARRHVLRARRPLGRGVLVEVLAEQRGLDAGGLQPGRQAVGVPALVAEGRPAATGRAQVGDHIVVVDVLAAQDGGPRRAAQRVGDGVVGEGHALVLEGREARHLLEQVPVEVVREDEDDVLDVVQRAGLGRGRVSRGIGRLDRRGGRRGGGRAAGSVAVGPRSIDVALSVAAAVSGDAADASDGVVVSPRNPRPAIVATAVRAAVAVTRARRRPGLSVWFMRLRASSSG